MEQWGDEEIVPKSNNPFEMEDGDSLQDQKNEKPTNFISAMLEQKKRHEIEKIVRTEEFFPEIGTDNTVVKQ